MEVLPWWPCSEHPQTDACWSGYCTTSTMGASKLYDHYQLQLKRDVDDSKVPDRVFPAILIQLYHRNQLYLCSFSWCDSISFWRAAGWSWSCSRPFHSLCIISWLRLNETGWRSDDLFAKSDLVDFLIVKVATITYILMYSLLQCHKACFACCFKYNLFGHTLWSICHNEGVICCEIWLARKGSQNSAQHLKQVVQRLKAAKNVIPMVAKMVYDHFCSKKHAEVGNVTLKNSQKVRLYPDTL